MEPAVLTTLEVQVSIGHSNQLNASVLRVTLADFTSEELKYFKYMDISEKVYDVCSG